MHANKRLVHGEYVRLYSSSCFLLLQINLESLSQFNILYIFYLTLNPHLSEGNHLILPSLFFPEGPERRSAEIDEKNRRITAYHESGHAIVAYYTNDAMPINKATIMPRGPSLGHVRGLKPYKLACDTKCELSSLSTLFVLSSPSFVIPPLQRRLSGVHAPRERSLE